MALPFRTIRAVLPVPIVEELFWRAWLMRYLIDHAFETWRRITFELRAFLFVAEHGSYGDVSLLAGLLYNGWVDGAYVISGRLAHAVTNAVLSGYVIWTGNWQWYW